MKPCIYWYTEGGCYICEIPYSSFCMDTITEEEYRLFLCCGAGKTPKAAYEDWVEDCER